MPDEYMGFAMAMAHSFAVCLEMNYTPIEMRQLWDDELTCMEELVQRLPIPAPPAVINVIRLFRDVTAT